MQFFEVVRVRHSIRAFAAAPVEAEKLQTILETANCAPSAGNLQAYEIYVVTQDSHRVALARAAFGQTHVADAPIVLVFCAHPARSARCYAGRGIRLYALQDATIACVFAMLAATALGLATVWVGSFGDEAVRQVIGVDKSLMPVAMLLIGYAAGAPEFKPRRRLSELVHEVKEDYPYGSTT